MRRMRGGALLAVVAVGALLLAGCSDDDDGSDDGGSTATTEAATTDDTAMADPAGAETVELTAIDYGYEGVPAEVPAGVVTVELTNDGAEEHQATILQIPEGQTAEEYLGEMAAADGLLPDAQLFGGPNAAEPGTTRSATTVLDAGDYVFVCFIPSPTDGVPHVAKGQVAPFTVSEADEDSEAQLADPGQTIDLIDYSFDIPDDFDPTADVQIVNEGDEPHELVAYKVADGSTYDDALALLTTPPGSGGPPPDPFPIAGGSGVAAMGVGVANDTNLEMTEGTYVLICFLPGPDGLPHFVQGMVQPFEVGADGGTTSSDDDG